MKERFLDCHTTGCPCERVKTDCPVDYACIYQVPIERILTILIRSWKKLEKEDK